MTNVERRGMDLHSSLELDLVDVLLGQAVPVGSVRGTRYLNIPKGENENGLSE